MTLLELAERCEAATEADAFHIISEAALAIFGWQDERYKRVLRMLEAEAYESAAMTLVPEGWFFSVSTNPAGALAMVANGFESFARSREDASAASLALCAAALRARNEQVTK